MKTLLQNRLKDIISDYIHKKKCDAFKDEDNVHNEKWKALDSDKMGEIILTQLLEEIEDWTFIPCCHISGEHNPKHYKLGMLCDKQLANAYEALCKDMGINPVTRMKPGCGMCEQNPTERKGEGVHLFKEPEDIE